MIAQSEIHIAPEELRMEEPRIEVSECFDVRVVELAWQSTRMLWIWGSEKLASNPKRREGLVSASYRCERHYLMAMRLLGLRCMRGVAAELEHAYEIERQYLSFLRSP